MLDPEHEYRLRQAQQVHELEVLRQYQSQELMAQKVAFYQHHLQHGGVAQWAFHLAAHPEDTRMVINALQKDQLSAIESQLELIAGDTLEDYQKAESARSTLRVVKELNSRQEAPPQPPVPGRPASPPGGVPQQPYDPSRPYDPSQPQPYNPSPPYGAAAQPHGGAPAPGGVPGAPYAPPGPPVSHQPYVPPAPGSVPPGLYQAEHPAAPAAGNPYDQAPPPPAVAPTPVIPPAPSACPPSPPAPESSETSPE
jgi:hypothetical protein